MIIIKEICKSWLKSTLQPHLCEREKSCGKKRIYNNERPRAKIPSN